MEIQVPTPSTAPNTKGCSGSLYRRLSWPCGPRPAHLFLMLSVPGSRNAQVAPTVAITAAAREETTRPDLTWDRSGYTAPGQEWLYCTRAARGYMRCGYMWDMVGYTRLHEVTTSLAMFAP